MDDQKYVVIKRSEWEQLRLDTGSVRMPDPLDDAVVIRTKDIFAGPVLETYAGAVQTAIEVIQGTSSDLARSWIEDLEAIRDYFHERAQEAQTFNHKRFPTAP